MRLTAEQYDRRHENLLTGVYEVKPPSTERRGRKKVTPCCENCGRETEFLFPGFVAPLKKIGEDEYTGMTPREVIAEYGLNPPFAPTEGMVCIQCRPLSNLELEELNEHR